MGTKAENIDKRLEFLENNVQGLFLRIDNLEKENEDLRKENQLLLKENIRLGEENSDLRARLKMNSTNSSKPPSSDGLMKKPAFPRQKGGKRGGQKGHKGNTLKLSSSPDKFETCKAERCQRCGSDLTSAEHTVVSRRQVIDLPAPKLYVREYQLCQTKCPVCNENQRGSYPPDVTAPVQYGQKLRALTILLNNEYKIPYKKISSLILDLYGYDINASTISAFTEICSDNLSETEKVIKQAVTDSPVVHLDETGIRIEGKTKRLHNSSTDLYTYLYAHIYRGVKALESKESVVKKINGWGIHDCYSSYFVFSNFKHAICGAHLIRELRFQVEIRKRRWADKFKDYLLELYMMSSEERIKKRSEIENRFDELCLEADMEEPPAEKKNSRKDGKGGRVKRTQGRNLFERMRKYKDNVLAFAFNTEVPFTNNQAERDIRPAKIKLKISGCFRSFKGAEDYARIQSFISTARKHNRNVFYELCSVFAGYSFLAPTCT